MNNTGPYTPIAPEAVKAAREFAIALDMINSPSFEARGYFVQEAILGKAKRAAKELVRLCSPLFELLVEQKGGSYDVE